MTGEYWNMATGDHRLRGFGARRTKRLCLRAHNAGDASRLAELLGDLAVAGNLARVPHPYSLLDAHDWLARLPTDPEPQEATFAIAIEGEGLIGAVGFRAESVGTVIGYWLGRPYWGQGYAKEAVIAALEWHFAVTGASRIGSGAFVHNAASLAIQHKLGFVETGRGPVHCRARGEEIEHINTELTRPAFELATRCTKSGR